jgi:hypothetical protein
MSDNTRKSATLFTEYEPENNRWVIKDTKNNNIIMAVPDDGGGNVEFPSGTQRPTNLSDATVREVDHYELDDSNIISTVFQFTADVSTSGKTILARPSDNLFVYGFYVVVGEGGSNERFVDTVGVLHSPGSTDQIIRVEDAAPSSRTYSVESANLNLTMASGTYQIGVYGVGFRVT